MYLCLECNDTFESPIDYKNERLEHFGHVCYEYFNVSPCCHAIYAETFECDECGEYITDDYIETDSGVRICNNCYITKTIGEDIFI